MKQKTSYDVQQLALKSVKDDFTKAAKKAKNILYNKLENETPLCNTSLSLNFSLYQVQFLIKASKGEYLPSDDYYRLSGSLWTDYLFDIDKCHYGFNSVHNNIYEVDKLMKQNGPKKMEDRLKRFLKRRINKAIARVK